MERCLIPRSFIEKENKQRKLTAFQNAVIRFVFGSGSVVQTCFYSCEPGNLSEKKDF